MNEMLVERIRRRLEALADDRAYQVLDYIEFLESKYAERPAGAPAFQRVAETLEDTLRAGRVPVNVIRGTMDAVGKAGRFFEGLAAAGRAVVDKAGESKPAGGEAQPVAEQPSVAETPVEDGKAGG